MPKVNLQLTLEAFKPKDLKKTINTLDKLIKKQLNKITNKGNFETNYKLVKYDSEHLAVSGVVEEDEKILEMMIPRGKFKKCYPKLEKFDEKRNLWVIGFQKDKHPYKQKRNEQNVKRFNNLLIRGGLF